MKSYFNSRTSRNRSLRKDCATVACLLLATVIFSCDSGPEYYPVDYPTSPREPERRIVAPEWKPIDGDKTFMANLGRDAMATIGYDEIIRRAEKVGLDQDGTR